LQPEPLTIQNEAFFKSFQYHSCRHTTSAVEWRRFWPKLPYAPAAVSYGLCYDERHQVMAAKPLETVSDVDWRRT
jgi:hypothetical protein